MVAEQQRRTFLAGVSTVAGLGLAGCSDLVGEDENNNNVNLTTLTIDSDGTQAYLITGVEGVRSELDVVPDGLNENNPELSLIEEDRYRFEADDNTLEDHPMKFNDEDGDALLNQEGAGTFEDDDDINWIDDGDAVEFTLTESLQERLVAYQCDIHSGMEGTIIEGADDDSNGGGGGIY